MTKHFSLHCCPKRKAVIRYSLLLIFVLNLFGLDAQDSTLTTAAGLFEGKVTFIHQILNPNNKLISDDEFYRDMPNSGKSYVILYIRGNQFKWDYPERTELYLPSSRQLAISSKLTKDSIYFAPANIAEEPLEKIEKSSMTKRLLNYDLSSIVVHTKWDTRTFFYSPLALKTNPNFWKLIKRDYLGDVILKTNSFPLMIHQKSLLGNWIMAASKIEAMKLDDSIFALPNR